MAGVRRENEPMTTSGRLARLRRYACDTLRLIEGAAIPNSCAFCGDRLGLDAVPVCAGCAADLPWIRNSCQRCGSPAPVSLPADPGCGRCQLDPPPYDAAVVLFHYSFPVDAAIKAFKFRRRLHYAPAFASLLADAAGRLPSGIDGLLPVPLHWRRQAMRGFNQARELCEPLQSVLGIRIIEQVRRSRATPPQSGLAAVARQRNLRNAFVVRGRLAASHVLIVDDVLTTGATCGQLARVLRGAGARQVSVLAVARAATPD